MVAGSTRGGLEWLLACLMERETEEGEDSMNRGEERSFGPRSTPYLQEKKIMKECGGAEKGQGKERRGEHEGQGRERRGGHEGYAYHYSQESTPSMGPS